MRIRTAELTQARDLVSYDIRLQSYLLNIAAQGSTEVSGQPVCGLDDRQKFVRTLDYNRGRVKEIAQRFSNLINITWANSHVWLQVGHVPRNRTIVVE